MHTWTDFPDTDQPEPSSYIPPADRPAAWAAMAAGLRNDGKTTTQIAEALWVDEQTVGRLLNDAGRAA